MPVPRQTDRLYADPRDRVEDFVFDEKVAAVFPDMLERSIPGYPTILRMIGLLASQSTSSGLNYYDLGSSLGAASLSMARSIRSAGCRVIAVDNSPAMVTRARELMSVEELRVPVEFRCADILDQTIEDAGMVVLNFTLQFIPKTFRQDLMGRIYRGMRPGAFLVLSEKMAVSDPVFQQLFIDMHHQFKKDQGYSDLEISQKRSALERVLIPETLQEHQKRLTRVGFMHCHVWFQCFNFTSLVAIR